MTRARRHKQHKHLAAEILTGTDGEARDLHGQLRDLVAILGLPIMWRGQPPREIASSLAEVLVALQRLDLAYVRVDRDDDPPLEVLERSGPEGGAGEDDDLDAATAGDTIRRALGDRDRATLELSSKTLRLARLSPRVDAERWFVAVASRREEFPTEAERFLLRAALDQAAITAENVRLYLEAREASRAKSEFLAVMSHELRTPLNAIIGYVDLLLMGIPQSLPDGSRSYAQRVEVSARHLLQLIDEILAFSRIEAGEEDLRIERVALDVLLRETAEVIAPLAREKGLEFRVPSDVPSVELETDPAKVRQILLNLLSNAVKFTDEGAIDLRAREDGARVHFEVRDTGIGIAPEKIERIFDPFSQVGRTPTGGSSGGTGLGLSVSRRLAGLLGGEIHVESTPGEGSTFRVLLPRSCPEE